MRGKGQGARVKGQGAASPGTPFSAHVCIPHLGEGSDTSRPTSAAYARPPRRRASTMNTPKSASAAAAPPAQGA